MAEADEGRFVEQYRPFVEQVVRRAQRGLRLTDDVDDLMQLGFEGLLQARGPYLEVRAQCQRRRVAYPTFQQFAYYRVRGAVVDGVRKLGALTRRQRERLQVEAGLDAVTEPWSVKPKQPRSREGAVRALDTALGAIAAAYVVSASTEDAGGDGDAEASPEAALLRHERKALVRKALAKLDEREQRIIDGHYLQGRRLDDVIGEVGLGRSQGRHVHNRELGKLREALESA